jgi:hypothetical protein
MYLYFSLIYLGVIIVDITYVEILVGMLLCVGMWLLKPNYFLGGLCLPRPCYNYCYSFQAMIEV